MMPTELKDPMFETLLEEWPGLSCEERRRHFAELAPEEAQALLEHLSASEVYELIRDCPPEEQRKWLSRLPPDDIADLVQQVEEEEERERLLNLLDPRVRAETVGLLVYAEDVAGGLMNPRFARIRPEMTVAEAIAYLRTQKRNTAETIYYSYVIGPDERLLGVVSFRDLVTSPPEPRVHDIMTTDLVTVPEQMDQEEVSRVFTNTGLWCVPVVDAEGRMKGVVTADDIADVIEEENTEDMQKMGGSEALELPYLQASLGEMLLKRGGWLVGLLLLGFLTVEALSRYEARLQAEMAVLLLFIPLIISSGGNTGSQAATLVVRAMALGEVRLRDWWRVIRRELVTGLGLGAALALASVAAAMLWNLAYTAFTGHPRLGQQPLHVAVAVAASVLCVVLWGTIVGSMLPFLLRRVGADPASSSAPLVTTILDATGLIIYFTVGGMVLRALS